MGISDRGGQDDASEQQMLEPGASVIGKDTGVSGGLAWDTTRQCLVLVSCEHVFGSPDTEIVSFSHTPVARVVRTAYHADEARYDAAIADPYAQSRFRLSDSRATVIYDIDTLDAPQDVAFYDRYIQRRTARWTAKELSGKVPGTQIPGTYERFVVLEDADELKGLAVGGDSGSILFHASGDDEPALSVGMLFGATTDLTQWYAFHLADVFNALELQPLKDAPFWTFLASACGEDEEPFEFLYMARGARGVSGAPSEATVARMLRESFGDEAMRLALALTPALRVALLERLLNSDDLRHTLWQVIRIIVHAGPDEKDVPTAAEQLRELLKRVHEGGPLEILRDPGYLEGQVAGILGMLTQSAPTDNAHPTRPIKRK